MKMQISIVSLNVDDVDRAVDFYTKTLGWQKTMDVPMGDDRWVTVAPDGGDASFTLSKREAGGAPASEDDRFSRVILETDDVHAAAEQLKAAGVTFTDGPRDEPWGGWAMFADSEGNVHGLHSPPAGGSR